MVTAERNLRRALEARGMVLVLAVGFVLVPSSYAQTFEQYRQRAIESSRAKSWDDAIANYRRALDLEPNDALTRFNLALALKYRAMPAGRRRIRERDWPETQMGRSTLRLGSYLARVE
jgi:tetratricopeptide (TPR) repeat protein